MEQNSLQEIDRLAREIGRHPLTTEIDTELSIGFTHHSTKIEGSTFTLDETKSVLLHNIRVNGKGAYDNEFAINHDRALKYIKAYLTKPFTESYLLQIHALVCEGIMGDPGKYRTVNVRAGSHIAPHYIKLYNLIPAYFEFYQQRLPTMHPFELAAEMKCRLVHIHPFLDGNGRTARLVMNLLLMQAGYPLVNIKGDSENRAKYIASLEQTNLGDQLAFFRYLKGVALEDYRKLLQILQPKDTPL